MGMESSLLNESLSSNGLQCDRYSIFSILWLGYSAVCFILGLPATLMVLMELHEKSCQNVSNGLFMLNLTILDLIYILVIPFSVVNFMVWDYMPFECIDITMDAFTLCTRPLFMACICVDCYFAIVHPITYRTNKKSSIIRKLTFMIVWLVTIGFISHKCSQMSMFPPPLNSAPLIVALLVIIFCDISILRALRKPDPTGKSSIHPQKKRALHTIFSSLVMTSITYLPPVVIFSFADLLPLSRDEFNCRVAVFGFWFSMSGCVLMPVLYLNTVGKLENLKDSLKKYIWI